MLTAGQDGGDLVTDSRISLDGHTNSREEQRAGIGAEGQVHDRGGGRL